MLSKPQSTSITSQTYISLRDKRLKASLNHSLLFFFCPRSFPSIYLLFTQTSSSLPLSLTCSFILSSWWVANLTWRRTSSSRRRRASAAWWSCCPTARWRARPRSGACSQPYCARACATCRPAPRWAWSSRCCSKWALWTTWLQVRHAEEVTVHETQWKGKIHDVIYKCLIREIWVLRSRHAGKLHTKRPSFVNY